MLTDHESGLVFSCLENIVGRVHWDDREAERLIGWMRAHKNILLQGRGANALARWLRTDADLLSAREGRFPKARMIFKGEYTRFENYIREEYGEGVYG